MAKEAHRPVVYASTLTEQEQRRFIILDNVGFGDWDWDELANKWDGEELGDWGLDNWGAGDGWANGDMAGTGTGEGNAEGEDAGDAQKGLVFGACGYEFIGIELRQEQVDVNNDVIKDRNLPIKYICDDGQNVAKHIEHDSQDMLFSCPPYYDLEVYSDMPNDASNQGTYEDFLLILRNAYKAAIGCLKQNRFAVIVVGDVRNKKTGFYYNFIDDIKRIFRDNGMPLYNEMILVEACATTALRASRYMDFRKVGKMHQNVLVFYKGDTKQIKSEFPPIELTDE